MRCDEVIKFSEAYGFANFTWSLFLGEESGVPEYMPITHVDTRSKRLQERRQKPHRDTILHLYLQRLYRISYMRAFEEHRDDMLDLIVLEYETVLKYYDIPFLPFELPPEMSHGYEQIVIPRIDYLRRKIPVSRIAQDTFQLLFRDRRFLMTFNLAVARGSVGSPRVRRVSLPNWLRRGVFYRDNGRCIACKKDLTGAGFLNDGVHFDHIVPIAEGGSNDPTNFQLLCAGCNHHKAATISTSEYYPVFWSVSLSD